jgi:hypothetical protein
MKAAFFGYIGKWTLYAISLGRCNRDHEEVLCVMSGILLCAGLVVLRQSLC